MLNKKQLIELFETLDVPFNEAILSSENSTLLPRIAFWEFLWNENTASNEVYDTTVTYQISFVSNIARDPGLLRLKQALNNKGYTPTIEHEFLEKEREFHSYLAVDIKENLNDLDHEL